MRGFRLVRIRGIELRAHWSLVIIIVLVSSSLALGEVPREYRRWSDLAAWSTGLGVAFGLVASIALHEFAHSLTAQRVGLRVPQVTLFAFGGIAQLGERPTRASHEFAITIAGPLTSLVLGVVLLAASTVGEVTASASPAAVATLIALVLGQVNIALAVFNCLPGAPLDGGRLLHSVIWRTTGSEARATAISTRSGQVIGTALAAAGVLMLLRLDVPVFGTGAGGAWLILIGWFIAVLARTERMSAEIENVASGAPISGITRTLPVARADTPLNEFTDGGLLPHGAHALPVVDGDEVIGIASLRDALMIDEPMRADVQVRSVMTPWDEIRTISADSTIADALRAFSELDVHQIPVIDGAQVIGFVHRDDLHNWLRLHAQTPRPTRGAP